MIKVRLRFLILGILLFIGCVNSNSQTHTGKDVVSATAKVVDAKGLDGCRFLLELSDGKKLIPLSLPPTLSKDGLEVHVQYRFKKSMMSICMAGPTVELLKIEKK